MSAIARTYTFIDGTDAYGSQVENEFNTSYNAWNNHDAGTSKWTVVSAFNASAAPLIADNSSGTNDIVNFKDNGSTVVLIADGGYVRGVAGAVGTPSFSFTGDTNTGIFSSTADQIDFSCGGTTRISLSTVALSSVSSSFQFLPPGNSATAPSYSFNVAGGTNTGFYMASADIINISHDGSNTYNISATAFTPVGAGVISTGDGTNYWNDISYKTLTDRGCLPWCDNGVELANGKVVSDVEAIQSIQKSPSKMTVHGVPMLDYKSFPKLAFRKAMADGKLLERDQNDEPVVGNDGIEMTFVFGVMLGAIKELDNRLKKAGI